MFDLSDQTFWLNVVNIALGLITLVCVVAVLGVTLRELAARSRKRVPVFARHDDHTFDLSDLGITMADGGEKLDGHYSNDDDRNIYRSNN